MAVEEYFEGYRSDSDVRRALQWSSPELGSESESGSLISARPDAHIDADLFAAPTNGPESGIGPAPATDAAAGSTVSEDWPPMTPTEPYESDGVADVGEDDAATSDDAHGEHLSEVPNDEESEPDTSDDDDDDANNSDHRSRSPRRSVSPSMDLTFGPNHPLGHINEPDGSSWPVYGPCIDFMAFEKSYRRILQHFTEIVTYHPLGSGHGGVSGTRSRTTRPSWHRNLGIEQQSMNNSGYGLMMQCSYDIYIDVQLQCSTMFVFLEYETLCQ